MKKNHLSVTFIICCIFMLCLTACSKKEPAPDPVDYTLSFYEACAFGNVETVEYHLEKGVGVNELDENGFPPLYYAVLGGNPDPYGKALDSVINALKNDKDEDLYAALDTLAEVKSNSAVVDLLLQKGANISLMDRRKISVTAYAAIFGDSSETLKTLVNAGGDLNCEITIQYPCSLLSFACMINTNEEVIDYPCVESAKIGNSNNYGTTPIMWAAMYNANPGVINILKKNGGDINDPSHKNGYTPLIWSVRCNRNPAMTEKLLQLGADPYAPDNDGRSAFLWAVASAKKDHFEKLVSAKAPDYPVLKEALVLAVDSDDQMFGMLVDHMKERFSEFKEELGADLQGLVNRVILTDNLVKFEKLTSFVFNPEYFGQLSAYMDDKDFAANPYSCSLFVASHCRADQIAENLIAKIPASETMDIDDQVYAMYFLYLGEEELLEKFLKAPFINVHQKNSDGRTLLYEACDNGYYSAAKILLERGADPDTTCAHDKNRTPLLTECYKKEPDLEIVKLLLQNGATVSVKDTDGVFPLVAAVWANETDSVVKELISNGANTKEKYSGKYVYAYCNDTIRDSYKDTYNLLYSAANGYDYWW